MPDEAKGNAVVMCFFAGLLVGAGLGLLFAPRAGAETRRTLSESAEGLRRRASETLHESQERVSHAVERGREAYESARDYAGKAKHQAEEAGKEVASRVSQAIKS